MLQKWIQSKAYNNGVSHKTVVTVKVTTKLHTGTTKTTANVTADGLRPKNIY